MYILAFLKKVNVNYHQAARVDPLVPVPRALTQAKKPAESSPQLLVDDLVQMTKRPMAQKLHFLQKKNETLLLKFITCRFTNVSVRLSHFLKRATFTNVDAYLLSHHLFQKMHTQTVKY